MGAYVRCNNWLVDKLTGEILDELDANPTFWNAVLKRAGRQGLRGSGLWPRAGSNALFGKRETDTIKGAVARSKLLSLAVVRSAAIGIEATVVGAIFYSFGYTFSSVFLTVVCVNYSLTFCYSLVLELYKNRIRKASNEVLDSVLSGC